MYELPESKPTVSSLDIPNFQCLVIGATNHLLIINLNKKEKQMVTDRLTFLFLHVPTFTFSKLQSSSKCVGRPHSLITLNTNSLTPPCYHSHYNVSPIEVPLDRGEGVCSSISCSGKENHETAKT